MPEHGSKTGTGVSKLGLLRVSMPLWQMFIGKMGSEVHYEPDLHLPWARIAVEGGRLSE